MKQKWARVISITGGIVAKIEMPKGKEWGEIKLPLPLQAQASLSEEPSASIGMFGTDSETPRIGDLVLCEMVSDDTIVKRVVRWCIVH